MSQADPPAQSRLTDRSPVWRTIRPFIMGGTAACMATTCVQPIDMVKVRIQLQDAKGSEEIIRNPLTMARKVISESGPKGLYRGLSAAIMRQLTYGMSRLGIFLTLQKKYGPTDGSPMPFSTVLACSLVAGGTGALIGTPADAALVRMQADSTLPLDQRRGYKNAIDALYKMAKHEGLKGFFAGASPTVYRGLSINVGMLSTYGRFKAFIAPKVNDNKPLTAFLAGTLSGWTASTVSLPFDFIKTRLQKQKPGPDGVLPYKNFLDCVRKVAAAEGVGAFYQGYATYVVRITPHIMLTWVFVEGLKSIKALQ